MPVASSSVKNAWKSKDTSPVAQWWVILTRMVFSGEIFNFSRIIMLRKRIEESPPEENALELRLRHHANVSQARGHTARENSTITVIIRFRLSHIYDVTDDTHVRMHQSVHLTSHQQITYLLMLWKIVRINKNFITCIVKYLKIVKTNWGGSQLITNCRAGFDRIFFKSKGVLYEPIQRFNYNAGSCEILLFKKLILGYLSILSFISC